MSDVQLYNLYFVNESTSAGQVCVYQDNDNIQFNQSSLTAMVWMLTGANPSVQVNFQWATDYDFAWFDYGSPGTQQIEEANLDTSNSVTFSLNQYGYYFQTPTSVSSGQISVVSDGSIPAVNNAVVGIGMHGAGTFSFPAKPNINSIFTPAQDANLVYWISFGAYPFAVNHPIDVSKLNTPAKISFPYGVYTMTAVLNELNLWTIRIGKPVTANASLVSQVTVYEAGKGVLS